MNLSPYSEVRDQMLPGDVIAFGGKGHFSEIIKAVTRAPVSHVGIIRHVQMRSDFDGLSVGDGRYFNEVCESTQVGDFTGVTTGQLSKRLTAYDGEVWWCPLGEKARALFNERAYFDWIFGKEGVKYDIAQAIQAGLDSLDDIPIVGRVTSAKRDYSKLFCSELVAAALIAAGVLPAAINPSEVTPIDLVRMAIYEATPVQLKPSGEGAVAVQIPGYNSVSVLA